MIIKILLIKKIIDMLYAITTKYEFKSNNIFITLEDLNEYIILYNLKYSIVQN